MNILIKNTLVALHLSSNGTIGTMKPTGEMKELII